MYPFILSLLLYIILHFSLTIYTSKVYNISSKIGEKMGNQNIRTEILLGESGVEKLKNSKVIIYGLGGVGSFACEAIARAGVGHIVLVDIDVYDISNINRQLGALHSTIGRRKVDVMRERILDINPECIVEGYTPDEIDGGEEFAIHSDTDYVVDCIDTMTTKLKLIERCNELGVKMISATSAGNKLDPLKFQVADIYETTVCPVCKVLRKELKARGIKKHKVVFSTELPVEQKMTVTEGEKRVLGSISFVPSVAGLIIAGEVIKDLVE